MRGCDGGLRRRSFRCADLRFWGREIGKLGHDVRLIPPAYVKPFVKRQKNDAADAEAICEAAVRPSMRFVPVKSGDVQGAAMVFRVRELLIRQRTQAINALRGHLTEFGEVVPQGAANAGRLIAIVEDAANGLPEEARATLLVLIETKIRLDDQIAKLNAEISRRAKENEVARRLMTIPGIGPLIATALVALAPPAETFRRGRDFAAWLGLVPRQHSTGGKQRLGATTKMGERSLRRLLIIGANSVIIKQHVHPMARSGTWLGGMFLRKPPMLVRVAACEQDGADRLGANGEERGLQGSGCGGVSRPTVARRRSERGQGAVWRNSRETGLGKPVCNRVPMSTRL